MLEGKNIFYKLNLYPLKQVILKFILNTLY